MYAKLILVALSLQLGLGWTSVPLSIAHAQVDGGIGERPPRPPRPPGGGETPPETDPGQCQPDPDGYECADDSTKRRMRQDANLRGERDGEREGAPIGRREGEREGFERGRDEGEREGRRRSYQEGENRGQHDGDREGSADGEREGLSRGDRDGSEKGRSDGLEAGYRDGYNRGDRAGYDRGYQDGLNSGSREQGYNRGYADGKAQAIREGQANGHRDGYAKGVREQESNTDRQAHQQASLGVPSQIEGPDAARINSLLNALQLNPHGESQFSALSINSRSNVGGGIRPVRGDNPYSHPELRSAYDRGFEEGFREGRQRAYDNSYREAYRRAYDEMVNRDYSDEYRRGYERGHQEAYRRAYDSSYQHSYRSAYDRSYRIAYDRHFPVRQDEGYRDGYEVGYSRGFNQGKTDAYNEGYREGQRQGYADFYQKTYDEYFQRGYQDALEYYRTHAVLRVEALQFADDNADGILQKGETFNLQVVVHNFGRVASGDDVLLKLSDNKAALDLPIAVSSLPRLAARTSTQLTLGDVGRASLSAVLGAAYRLSVEIANRDQGRLLMENINGQVLYPIQISEKKFSRVVTGKSASLTLTLKNISKVSTKGNLLVKATSLNPLARLEQNQLSLPAVGSGQSATAILNFQVDASTPQFEKLPFNVVVSDQEKRVADEQAQVYAIRPYAYTANSGFLLITDQIDKTNYRALVESLDRDGIAYDLWDLGNEGMINQETLVKYKDRSVLISLSKGLSLGQLSTPLLQYLNLGGNLILTGEGATREGVSAELAEWLSLGGARATGGGALSGIDFLTGTQVTLPTGVELEVGRLARPLLGPATELSLAVGYTPAGVFSSAAKAFSQSFEKSKRQYKAAVLPFDLANLSNAERDLLLLRLRAWGTSFAEKQRLFAASVQQSNPLLTRAISEGILAEFEEELVSDVRYKADFGRSIYYVSELRDKSRFNTYTKWATSQSGAVKTAALALWPEISKILESLPDKSGSSRYQKLRSITKPLR